MYFFFYNFNFIKLNDTNMKVMWKAINSKTEIEAELEMSRKIIEESYLPNMFYTVNI